MVPNIIIALVQWEPLSVKYTANDRNHYGSLPKYLTPVSSYQGLLRSDH
jgi:hypothetical protein